MSYVMLDSYTGLRWCGAALHLLDERNRLPGGRCRKCAARCKRESRARLTKARGTTR